MDELPNLQIKMKEMEKSQAFLASQYEDQLKTIEKLATSIKDLQQQLSTAMTIPTAPAAEQDAIVVSGVAESTAPAELQHFIQEIIAETMDLPDITVVTAERLGSQPKSEGVRPRKILVRLQTKQQAIATLKVAHRLKEYNSARESCRRTADRDRQKPQRA
ncbi:g5421 [Coccomyxa elongata]